MLTIMKSVRRVFAVMGLVGATGLAGLVFTPITTFASPLQHQSVLTISYEDPLPVHRVVRIGENKSMVVELPRDLRDVVVSDPEIVDAVVQSTNRVYLIARKRGQANAFFFDQEGQRIMTLELSVERDVLPLQNVLNRLLPGSDIRVEMLRETIILTGSVRNASDSVQASKIAARFAVSPEASSTESHAEKVVNMISVGTDEQVLLKVQVVEMNRDVFKRLGVNWSNVNFGDAAFIGGTQFGFPVTSGVGANNFLASAWGPSGDRANCYDGGGVGIPGTTSTAENPPGTLPNNLGAQVFANCLANSLEAFERHGLVRTLAEPTLTAISGETASFLAGGEFPIPVSQEDGVITVDYKPFGVSLSFTPMVQSANNISLKVATEVSEIDTNASVTTGTLSLLGLKVSRANTTVELASGSSLVLAGLISDDTRQNFDGLPGATELPILGSLFRSRDFRRSESELMIIITPLLVKPTAPQNLARPDDNWMPASDLKATFLGEMNRRYGAKVEDAMAGGAKDSVGWIIE